MYCPICKRDFTEPLRVLSNGNQGLIDQWWQIHTQKHVDKQNDLIRDALEQLVNRAGSGREEDHYSETFEADFARAAYVLDPKQEANNGIR